MKFTLGFSPCPNDTFIFDALVNSKIDTEGISFEPVLEDIQSLNQWAEKGKLDISKLSFPAYFSNEDHYRMLTSGAALGKGVGPLLVAKKMVNVPAVSESTVAIPGLLTTANFLLSFAFPSILNKIPMLFSEIEDAVVNGEADLGVIIHENRFTYHEKGLIKVCDLGEIWEEKQNAPIPLACIAARSAIDNDVRIKISRLIKKSIEFAFSQYPEITEYTRSNAQAMNEEVMRKHIDLYVNDYSLDLGNDGQKAIDQFKQVFKSMGNRSI